MEKKVQTGGFFFAIFQALFMFIAFVLKVVFTVVKILWVSGFLPWFLKFTLSTTIILSVFGFFGIFVTAIGIVYIYIKQIIEIRKENNVIRDYSRRVQGLSPSMN